MKEEILESPFPQIVTGIKSSKLVEPRTAKDPFASFDTIKSRGALFRTLEAEIIPSLSNPKLISSIKGSIQELLLTIPPFVFSYDQFKEPDRTIAEKYAHAFRAILREMPETTLFVVLVSEITVAKMKEWANDLGVSERINIIPAPDDVQFTVWAQDAYAICNDLDDSEKYFVEPASFNRADDAIIADIVASKTSLTHTQVSLYFQGGNILIGDEFWMIGADYPINSLKLGLVTPEAGETEREAVERVYGRYLEKSRKMHIIGSRVPVPSQTKRKILVGGEVWDEVLYFGNKEGTLQPLFHIDMFISFMGRDAGGQFHVCVGDPAMAAELLEQENWAWSMQSVFDDIAAQLATLGFVVHRNPLPMAYDDVPNEQLRVWYFATSNNVIVQDSPKIVWIPTYGHAPWDALSATDKKTREVWEALGYTVKPLPDFHPFAANLGAAHCISKYLSRSALLIS